MMKKAIKKTGKRALKPPAMAKDTPDQKEPKSERRKFRDFTTEEAQQHQDNLRNSGFTSKE